MTKPDAPYAIGGIEEARAFAIWAHRNQKYGALPYVAHLDQVFSLAHKHKAPPAVQVASYLHDVIEDAGIHLFHLDFFFGAEVAFLVNSVTDEPGANRRERHQRTYPKTRAAGTHAVFLKLCDRIANEIASIGTDKWSMYSGEERKLFDGILYLKDEHPEVEKAWAFHFALHELENYL
jgi:(p)ppGpp synthase/HD superfamily hydrolase